MNLIFRVMLDNYRQARRSPTDYSDLWSYDVYKEFEAIIQEESLWADFQGNGIAGGMGNARDFHGGRRVTPITITDHNQIETARGLLADLQALGGAEFIDQMSEVEIGGPPVMNIDGRSINIHDLRLTYNAWRFRDYIQGSNPYILEIGAGYGGLALKLKRLFPNAGCILIDLPEANAIQTYYLKTAMPDCRLFLREDLGKPLADFDFAILPPEAMGRLPGVDAVINIRSFAEMHPEIIGEYFQFIQKMTKPGGHFYNVNRYANGEGGSWVRFKDYPYDKHWKVHYSAPLWGQPRIHELITQRTTEDSEDIKILRGLPAGNVSFAKRLIGLGEHPKDPIAMIRRVMARSIKRISPG